jgi:hypothetical protein
MISKRFENGLSKYGIKMSDLKTFHYCGGDKGKHLNYYNLCYPKETLPDITDKCICGHRITENCYISNGEYVLTIGNCCIKRFIPIENQKRTCKYCSKVHRNRKDNLCIGCRRKMTRRVGTFIITFQ